MGSVLTDDDRNRIREEIAWRHECELEMRRKRNRQVLPWLIGMLTFLTALVVLTGHRW
jgi:hypothetical protein